jgi:16S rRNA (guanine527-N7)-methyltransferase
MTVDETLASLAIDDSSSRNLWSFVSLFEKWNRSINLSAASTRDELVEHLIDSLHVVPYLRERPRVLDVGSGGGFPVVVAAICLPAVSFTALEPVHKKHAFLRTVARELALDNLDARAERIEDHEPRDYDAAMSRATFDLVDWLRTGAQYTHDTGIVIGFEAVPRKDLPAHAERHPYALGGKQRAIVIVPRETAEPS